MKKMWRPGQIDSPGAYHARSYLRHLELEAYSALVAALRVQGELTDSRKLTLSKVCSQLHISPERHKAEIRRAVSDEKLSSTAEQLHGADFSESWQQEGDHAVPFLPQVLPQDTVQTVTRHVVAAAVASQAISPADLAHSWQTKVQRSTGRGSATLQSSTGVEPMTVGDLSMGVEPIRSHPAETFVPRKEVLCKAIKALTAAASAAGTSSSSGTSSETTITSAKSSSAGKLSVAVTESAAQKLIMLATQLSARENQPATRRSNIGPIATKGEASTGHRTFGVTGAGHGSAGSPFGAVGEKKGAKRKVIRRTIMKPNKEEEEEKGTSTGTAQTSTAPQGNKTTPGKSSATGKPSIVAKPSAVGKAAGTSKSSPTKQTPKSAGKAMAANKPSVTKTASPGKPTVKKSRASSADGSKAKPRRSNKAASSPEGTRAKETALSTDKKQANAAAHLVSSVSLSVTPASVTEDRPENTLELLAGMALEHQGSGRLSPTSSAASAAHGLASLSQVQLKSSSSNPASPKAAAAAAMTLSLLPSTHPSSAASLLSPAVGGVLPSSTWLTQAVSAVVSRANLLSGGSSQATTLSSQSSLATVTSTSVLAPVMTEEATQGKNSDGACEDVGFASALHSLAAAANSSEPMVIAPPPVLQLSNEYLGDGVEAIHPAPPSIPDVESLLVGGLQHQRDVLSQLRSGVSSSDILLLANTASRSLQEGDSCEDQSKHPSEGDLREGSSLRQTSGTDESIATVQSDYESIALLSRVSTSDPSSPSGETGVSNSEMQVSKGPSRSEELGESNARSSNERLVERHISDQSPQNESDSREVDLPERTSDTCSINALSPRDIHDSRNSSVSPVSVGSESRKSSQDDNLGGWWPPEEKNSTDDQIRGSESPDATALSELSPAVSTQGPGSLLPLEVEKSLSHSPNGQSGEPETTHRQPEAVKEGGMLLLSGMDAGTSSGANQASDSAASSTEGGEYIMMQETVKCEGGLSDQVHKGEQLLESSSITSLPHSQSEAATVAKSNGQDDDSAESVANSYTAHPAACPMTVDTGCVSEDLVPLVDNSSLPGGEDVHSPHEELVEQNGSREADITGEVTDCSFDEERSINRPNLLYRDTAPPCSVTDEHDVSPKVELMSSDGSASAPCAGLGAEEPANMSHLLDLQFSAGQTLDDNESTGSTPDVTGNKLVSSHPGSPVTPTAASAFAPPQNRKRKASGAFYEDGVETWAKGAHSLMIKICRFRGKDRPKGQFSASAWFLKPVDSKIAPGYHRVIKTPMDFGTIKKKLEQAKYASHEEWADDMELVKNNCHEYNPEDHQARKDCDEVFAFFDAEYGKLLQKWVKMVTPPAKKPRQSS